MFLRRGHPCLLDILLLADIRHDQVPFDCTEQPNELRSTFLTKQVRFSRKDIGIANQKHSAQRLASHSCPDRPNPAILPIQGAAARSSRPEHAQQGLQTTSNYNHRSVPREGPPGLQPAEVLKTIT